MIRKGKVEDDGEAENGDPCGILSRKRGDICDVLRFLVDVG